LVEPLRAFKYIRDPRAFEVVADETRRKIIYLLRAKDMTVSQLADALGKTPQAIYHQIKKLSEVGLVEVAREERVDHFIETYYRASAEVFEFHHGEAGAEEASKHYREAFEALTKVGIDVMVDDGTLKRVVSIETEQSKLGLPSKLEEKIEQLDEVGFLTKSYLYKLAQLVVMSDRQFEEMLESERVLRKVLTSASKKSTKH